MARATWSAARTKAERAAFDYCKESLTIKSGSLSVTILGVLGASQDRSVRGQSPDGTFPVLASLSCWREELGFVPAVNEAIRVARAVHPTEEQVYLVVSVDTTSEMLVIELQASTSNGNPFIH